MAEHNGKRETIKIKNEKIGKIRNKYLRVWVTEDDKNALALISQLKGTSISSTIYEYIIAGIRNEEAEALCVVDKELFNLLNDMISRVGRR
jgi:hypothetical protein